MPNTFPQELIDVVVDELHADMASLAACALSFRTMVASAQMHLFYKVTLAPPPAASKGGLKKASQCQRLAKILSSSPHLIPLIKDLRIIDDDPNSESWMVNSARSLSTILPLLTLKRISIRCALGSVDWDHMPRALKAPLQNIFKSPGLQSIQLHGIFLTEPRSSPLYLIFGDASDLRELSFSYETRKRVNPNVGPSDWQPKLTSLAITSNNTEDLILTLLNPKIYFSCLRTLCLASLLDPEINQLLTAIQDRSAIESLTIFYSHDWVFTSGLSALRSMKSLRSLRICTNTIRDGMVAVIRDDCAPNVSLEHITIEMCVFTAARHSVTEWTELTTALVDSGKTADVLFHRMGLRGRRQWTYKRCLEACLLNAVQGLPADVWRSLTVKESEYVSMEEVYASW